MTVGTHAGEDEAVLIHAGSPSESGRVGRSPLLESRRSVVDSALSALSELVVQSVELDCSSTL